MTAYQHYELHCDAPGCLASYNSGETRADLTRASAASEGWVHGVVSPVPPVRKGGPAKSLDFCAVHADQLGDVKPKALPEHARPIE